MAGNLKKIFDEISEQMKSSFREVREALSHSGNKGTANEEIVREFLKKYLPKTFHIISGELIDSHGKRSKQLDIIICDATKTPLFYRGETQVVPIEFAYAVIEVKAFLNNSDLKKAYENMLSVKSLKKEAYFRGESDIILEHYLYGKTWTFWPIHYFVFAYDSYSIESVLDNFEMYHSNAEIHKRIDSICVLEKGMIVNEDVHGMYSCLPDATSTAVTANSKPLLLFYLLLSTVLNQAKMRPVNLALYAKGIEFTK